MKKLIALVLLTILLTACTPTQPNAVPVSETTIGSGTSTSDNEDHGIAAPT